MLYSQHLFRGSLRDTGLQELALSHMVSKWQNESVIPDSLLINAKFYSENCGRQSWKSKHDFAHTHEKILKILNKKLQMKTMVRHTISTVPQRFLIHLPNLGGKVGFPPSWRPEGQPRALGIGLRIEALVQSGKVQAPNQREIACLFSTKGVTHEVSGHAWPWRGKNIFSL